MTDLDLREQLARIDRELADGHDKASSAKWRPWQVVATSIAGGLTAGAALMGAGVALAAFLFRLR